MRHTEPGIVVEISREGLRRAHADNTLMRIAKTRDTLGVWIAVVALGIFMGWSAVERLAS